MPFTFLLSLFTGSKLKLTLIAIAVALVVGTGAWGFLTIRHLQRETAQIALKAENKALVDQVAQQAAVIAQVQADQRDYAARADQIAASLNALNAKLSASEASRQKTVAALIPTTPTGQHPDAAGIQTQVNGAMSQLFTDLQGVSQ